MEGIENISHLDKYDKLRVAKRPRHLQTPQVPPSLAQCLQYLQFLHALQLPEPVQVAVFAGMLADKQVRENAISIRKAGIFSYSVFAILLIRYTKCKQLPGFIG